MDRYGTYDGFVEYHTTRGRVIPPTWTEEAVEAALLIGSEFIDARYGASYSGQKAGGREQVRLWPRINAYDVEGEALPSDAVPVEVENATYEAAWRQRENPGSLIIDYTPGKYKRASVHGAVSVEYASFSYASDAQPQFMVIDGIIAPVLSTVGSGSFSPLSGAITRV